MTDETLDPAEAECEQASPADTTAETLGEITVMPIAGARATFGETGGRNMSVSFQVASAAEMDPVSLYSVLKLRNDVFVVEQGSAYEELDGRDIEPAARLFWAEDDGRVLATLRVLAEQDGWRIGRVATATTARGHGLAAELMRRAVEGCAGEVIVLDAQQPLERWYQIFGFARSGEVFFEDGIPHIPMKRAAATSRSVAQGARQ